MIFRSKALGQGHNGRKVQKVDRVAGVIVIHSIECPASSSTSLSEKPNYRSDGCVTFACSRHKSLQSTEY